MSNSATPRPFVSGLYGLCGGIAQIRGTIDISMLTTNASVAFFYQLANYPDGGVAPVAFGNSGGAYVTATGLTYPDQWTDMTTAVADRQLIRWGMFCKNVSGTLTEFAQAGGYIEIVLAS
ncbi:MAG: hypothetical protein Q8Q52_05800 [Acidimicrobiia bacterium]|nr:hypothetical protein [Acidimicrobiia bacterium]